MFSPLRTGGIVRRRDGHGDAAFDAVDRRPLAHFPAGRQASGDQSVERSLVGLRRNFERPAGAGGQVGQFVGEARLRHVGEVKGERQHAVGQAVAGAPQPCLGRKVLVGDGQRLVRLHGRRRVACRDRRRQLRQRRASRGGALQHRQHILRPDLNLLPIRRLNLPVA
jgi:hypothetical protein